MPRRLLKMIGDPDSRSQSHEVTWEGQDVPGASGLTPFQERCEAQLNAYLSSRGLALRERRQVVGANEVFVHGFLGDTNGEVWIYLDQVEVRIPGGRHTNLERWDAPTPEGLVETFLAAVREAVQ